MNHKSIQILRGSKTYDPKTSTEVLLDGQPFYSKKTKELYIGDGQSELRDLKGTQIGIKSVDQLTVKDNIIAINSNASNQDMVGIIAITGSEQYVLHGNYMIDGTALFSMANITSEHNDEVPWLDTMGPYEAVFGNDSIISRFNSLNLFPVAIISGKLAPTDHFTPDDVDYFKEPLILDSYCPGLGVLADVVLKSGERYPCYPISKWLSYNMDGTFDWETGPNMVVKFENQIISNNDIDFISQFIKTEFGEDLSKADLSGNKAYAAPIYDKSDDTLKIGVGTYEKDSDGNITSFTFGQGQEQSLVTRDKNLKNLHVPIYFESSKKLATSQISQDISMTYIKFFEDDPTETITFAKDATAHSGSFTNISNGSIILNKSTSTANPTIALYGETEDKSQSAMSIATPAGFDSYTSIMGYDKTTYTDKQIVANFSNSPYNPAAATAVASTSILKIPRGVIGNLIVREQLESLSDRSSVYFNAASDSYDEATIKFDDLPVSNVSELKTYLKENNHISQDTRLKVTGSDQGIFLDTSSNTIQIYWMENSIMSPPEQYWHFKPIFADIDNYLTKDDAADNYIAKTTIDSEFFETLY